MFLSDDGATLECQTSLSAEGQSTRRGILRKDLCKIHKHPPPPKSLKIPKKSFVRFSGVICPSSDIGSTPTLYLSIGDVLQGRCGRTPFPHYFRWGKAVSHDKNQAWGNTVPPDKSQTSGNAVHHRTIFAVIVLV